MQVNIEEREILVKYGIEPEKLCGVVSLHFQAGDYFIWEGHPIQYLYFVVSGKAKVCINGMNGKQLLLCYFVSQGIIGDIELMTGQKEAFTTIQAVSSFDCIGIPMEINRQALKNNIDFMNSIGLELALKLKESDTRGVIQGLYTLEERLCGYILQTEKDDMFIEKLVDVAALLGTSYRHLLRELVKLCGENILKKEQRGYKIINSTALAQKGENIYKLHLGISNQ